MGAVRVLYLEQGTECQTATDRLCGKICPAEYWSHVFVMDYRSRLLGYFICLVLLLKIGLYHHLSVLKFI